MNSSRTILFYINSIDVGGAERVILQLAHHFSQAGYRSILVTSFSLPIKNVFSVRNDPVIIGSYVMRKLRAGAGKG